MKVMGICAGRKKGNSEMLLKEALLACREEGAEVRLISLMDYNIKHCSGCETCAMGMVQGKNVGCIFKDQDDMEKIMQVFFRQDAILFGVPTYDLMPSSRFLTFSHRFISYETAFLRAIGAIPQGPDRVAGLIAVGGSTRSWQSMSLECLGAAAFMQSLKVVDQMMTKRCGRPGSVVLHPEHLERARQMGKNIITAINTPPGERTWLGDEGFGWCPNCHSNVLQLGEEHFDGKKWKVDCVVCGVGGDIEKDADGKLRFVIDNGSRDRDRLTHEGNALHLREITETAGYFFANKDKAKELSKKYEEIKIPGLVD